MDKRLYKLAFQLGYGSGMRKLAQTVLRRPWSQQKPKQPSQPKQPVQPAQPVQPNQSGQQQIVDRTKSYIAQNSGQPRQPRQQQLRQQQPQQQPNWATQQGQANWQRKYQMSDARTREQMLKNLDSRARGLSGTQWKQFQGIAQRMRDYANTFDRPEPKDMQKHAPGVYGSSMDEIRRVNTPAQIQHRQMERADAQAANPYINPLNPNGIGPTYNGRLFTGARAPSINPRQRVGLYNNGYSSRPVLTGAQQARQYQQRKQELAERKAFRGAMDTYKRTGQYVSPWAS